MPRDLLGRAGGVSEFLHTQNGDEFTVERVQDVEPLIELNKRMALDNPSGMGASREWKHVAEIPLIVWEKWCAEHGREAVEASDGVLLKRLLNDPDWRYLRTSEGRF